jgi:hypothetical protein
MQLLKDTVFDYSDYRGPEGEAKSTRGSDKTATNNA